MDSWKGKLDNARRLWGIYFIDPETLSSKKSLRMIERNWKHQCLPPCLARLARKSSMVRPAARLISRLNLCVFWKLVNLQDCVWETSSKISWGLYCRKRWQITAALQFGLQIYSNVATMKIHAAKAAVIKRNVTNWKRFWRGTWRKSEEIRGDQWSKGQGHQSSFCLTDGHSVIWRMLNWRQGTNNTKVEL